MDKEETVKFDSVSNRTLSVEDGWELVITPNLSDVDAEYKEFYGFTSLTINGVTVEAGEDEIFEIVANLSSSVDKKFEIAATVEHKYFRVNVNTNSTGGIVKVNGSEDFSGKFLIEDGCSISLTKSDPLNIFIEDTYVITDQNLEFLAGLSFEKTDISGKIYTFNIIIKS